MTNTLKLEIVTPQGTIYSEEVDRVTLPGVEGELGVLPQHVPLMTRLMPGEIKVRKGIHESFLIVGEGLIEITGKHVAVLTDMAISSEKANQEKIEEARRRAEIRLHDQLSHEEVASVNASLARSVAKLNVKRRQRG